MEEIKETKQTLRYDAVKHTIAVRPNPSPDTIEELLLKYFGLVLDAEHEVCVCVFIDKPDCVTKISWNIITRIYITIGDSKLEKFHSITFLK